MTLQETWILVKTAAVAWNNDHVQSMGAALAYYTMFSIAPLLLIVISITGFVFGEEAVRGEIAGQLRHLMGEQGALTVQLLLQSVSEPVQGFGATVIGVGLLLFGATSVFGELQNSLDRIWRVPVRSRTSGLWGLLRSRLLSFGMILGIGFILMVSLVFSAGLTVIGKWWSPLFEGWELMANTVNFLLSFVFTTGMFALIYKIMPHAHIRWSEVWIGAAITALLFTIGKFLIGLYIVSSAVTSGFGTAGSLVALLVWVYYSAQIFLMGAEFTWAYSHIFGSRKREPAPRSLVVALDESGIEALSANSRVAQVAQAKILPASLPPA